ADPKIDDIANAPSQHPAATSPHASALQHADGSPAETDGAPPGRGRVAGIESASPKFDEDGGNRSAHATGEGSPLADHGHHADADPKINDDSNAGHPADNSRHTHAQDDDDGSPAVTDGAHPGHGQADRSESASPKFADDGGTNSGKVSHEPPALTALSNEVSGDDPAHGAHTPHGQADRSEPASPKSADDGDAHPGKVSHEPPALTALPNEVSGDDSAQDRKSLEGETEGSDAASPKVAEDGGHNAGKVPDDPPGLTALASEVSGDDPAHGAHTAHGQADGSDSASPKFADDGGTNSGKVPHDPAAPTALPSDVSGDDSA